MTSSLKASYVYILKQNAKFLKLADKEMCSK